MRVLLLLLATLAAATSAPIAGSAQSPVTAEFRVFEGTEEITHRTRLVVMPAGEPERRQTVAESKRPTVMLMPGLYDVQALKLEGNAVTAIARVDRLMILHYPDEGSRHLEVINFAAGYGALQLRSASQPPGAYSFAVYPARTRHLRAPPAAAGSDYALFVLPAGSYDVHIRDGGTSSSPDTEQWQLDVQIPPERTRLKVID